MNGRDGALRILLQFLRAQDAGDPHAFRFEPQDYILPIAGGESPCSRFNWTREVLDELQALRRPGRDPAVVQRLGGRLRRFVENAGWEKHHEPAIIQALAQRRPVFVTIRSSAAELYALPWELLTLKTGQYIGGLDGLLLRFEWPASPSAVEQPRPRPEGGRILFAWSAAGGAVPAAEHFAAISSACTAGFHSFDPEADVVAQASLGRIAAALEAAQQTGQPIAVLHLLCHGGSAGSTFGLCLDGEGTPVVVDAAQVRDLLSPFAHMVRLVVLSACDSGNLGELGNHLGSVAQALHRCGFQSVIASRLPLSVTGSVQLAESFYGSLLAGPMSVEASFLASRKRLARGEANLPGEQRSLDWASMQLYAHHKDGDDTRPIVFRPYRGLLAFQPEHRRFFFGRDREVQEILTDLQALIDGKKERFLVVAGASGTGKSSVVLAGAVPKLLEKNPQLSLLRMRPGSDPERALAEALGSWPTGSSALLIVDQFEEVFTQTPAPAARDAFVRRLWSLAEAPDPGLRVIITLRVDFIGRCGELVVNAAGLRLDRVAYDERYRVFIAQLEPEQLRSAINEPARKVGLNLEPGLVDRMLEEVGNEPGALPLLEDVLDVLWLHREERMLTQARYNELGGVVGALQRRADAIVDKLSKDDLSIAQRLLVNLVAVADDTTLDTRLRVALADLEQSFSMAPAAGFERVLKEMVSARLLVQDGDEQSSRVEVAHEALIRKWPRLRAWLDEDRARLLIQRRVRQAAQQWAAQNHDESLLYRGGQLAQATEWRKRMESRLGQMEWRFLAASEELQEQTRQKELEVTQRLRDGLLLAVAQTCKEDPTESATILREVAQPDSRLWTQSALSALHAGIAEVVLRGHESAVYAVAFSPDGRKIVTVSRDQTARVWAADGSGVLVVRKVHEAYIYAVAFSPDGSKIVTGSWDKTACIWNADGSGVPITLRGHQDGITSVAFSPDGRSVLTGSDDNTARLWSADGSGSPTIFQGHSDKITAIAFSSNGRLIATGSRDETVRIWNVDGSGSRILFKEREHRICSIAFSSDGRRIATGSLDRTARIWWLDGSTSPVVLSGHQSYVYAVAFSPSGETVATGSGDKTVRVWHSDGTGSPIVLHGHSAPIYSVAFRPDGRKLATASDDKTARIWSVVGSHLPIVLKHDSSAINSVAFSPGGERVATACEDGAVCIWNSDGTGSPVVLKGHGFTVYSVAFSPDGKKVITGSEDKTARIWNVDGSGAATVLRGHESTLYTVAFSPDGKKVITGSADKTARIWNTDGSGSPVVLAGHESFIYSAAFSLDGGKIVTGSEDRTARVWNADGSGASILLRGHESSVNSVAFSPDGNKVVTGSLDKTARIWNSDDSGSSVVIKSHDSYIYSVAFSPNGDKIVTGSEDKTARVWNADGSGAPVELRGHKSAITSVAFSPNGKKIITGSRDKTARIWIVSSDALMAALWDATTDCLPIERRHELLLEAFAEAKLGQERCRQEIARRRGWPKSAVP